MFELNKEPDIKEEIFDGSKIITIDNFYSDPDSIVECLHNTFTFLHKGNEEKSFNGILFEDRRHSFERHEVGSVFSFIESILVNQKPINQNLVITNCARFKKHTFNDFHNHYWWPHTDSGYTGLVYLNKDDNESGTNLYTNLFPETEPSHGLEHYEPWREKQKYSLLKTLKPAYNRLILFDGKKFLHGMNICDKRYFEEEFRMNQVLFFE